jgi:uncharacterized protein YecE (DUF72 family)
MPRASRTGMQCECPLYMRLHLGIGSWADADYKKLLTAPNTTAKERLKAYAAWFNHVEVNSSYYATPKISVVAEWVKQTPDGFTFDIKLHRAFSQNPHKAATEGDLSDRLLKSIEPLVNAERLGAFLLVLPPSFTPDNHRLEELTAIASTLRPHALAVELRHSDWVNGRQRDSTFAFFKEHGLAWVAVDMPRIKGATLMPPIDEVTRDDLAYLRLHGRNPHYLEAKSAADRHVYAYNDQELEEIAQRVRRLTEKAEHVHVIANNHAKDYAPKTALALKRLLEGGSN